MLMDFSYKNIIKYRFNPIYMGNFSADKILKDIKNKLVLGEELTLTDIA